MNEEAMARWGLLRQKRKKERSSNLKATDPVVSLHDKPKKYARPTPIVHLRTESSHHILTNVSLMFFDNVYKKQF